MSRRPRPPAGFADLPRLLLDASGDDLVDDLIAQWAAENPDLDTSGMPIVGRLIMIGRALEARTNAALQPFGLNYSDFDVLATLRRSGAPYELTPKQLMGSVLLTSGAMTAVLDRLEKRGLVSRNADHADGRVKTAKLSEAGLRLVDRAVVARFSDALAVASSLAPRDRQVLEPRLRQLVRILAGAARGTD